MSRYSISLTSTVGDPWHSAFLTTDWGADFQGRRRLLFFSATQLEARAKHQKPRARADE